MSLGKLSIEVGTDTPYAIVKLDSNGKPAGVVALKGHFETKEDANQAAKLLGPAQVGTSYTVEAVTLVNSRKGSPGRKPASTNASTDGQAATGTVSTPTATGTATRTPAPAGAKN
jgi:hypothetical protein